MDESAKTVKLPDGSENNYLWKHLEKLTVFADLSFQCQNGSK
jgi:hypothetical protein